MKSIFQLKFCPSKLEIYFFQRVFKIQRATPGALASIHLGIVSGTYKYIYKEILITLSVCEILVSDLQCKQRSKLSWEWLKHLLLQGVT